MNIVHKLSLTKKKNAKNKTTIEKCHLQTWTWRMTKWSSEIKEAIKLHVLLSFYVKTSQLRTVALLLLLLETQVQLQTDKMHAIATVLFVHCFVFVCLLVCIWFSGETWSLRTKTFIFHEINNFTWKHALHCIALHCTAYYLSNVDDEQIYRFTRARASFELYNFDYSCVPFWSCFAFGNAHVQ